MTKPINEYTTDELQAKIEAIKAERERTSNALKKYKEELERRKQEIPLGVPLADKEGAPFVGVYELGFPSEKSFFTFSTRFQNYVTATRDNTKCEPIDIKVLLPLLSKGWVAMDKDGRWHWYMEKPYIEKFYHSWYSGMPISFMGGFNLKPAENWETSLMECGL